MKNLLIPTIYCVFLNFILILLTTGCSEDSNTNPETHEVISWVRNIDLGSTDFLYSLREKNDGGFIIAGWRGYYDTAYSEVTIINLDVSADTLWTRHFHNEGYFYNNGLCAIQKPDGAFLISGESLGDGMRCVFVATLSEQGEWIRDIKIPTGNGVSFSHELFWEDGVCQFLYELSANDGLISQDTLHLVTIEEDGNILTHRKYPEINCFGQIQKPDNGNFLIPGNSNMNSNNRNFQLILLQPNGEISSRNSFGTDGYDVALSAEFTHDGNYLVAGFTSFSNTPAIYEINSAGEYNHKSYGDTLHIESNSIRSTGDRGYLFMNYYLNPDHQFSAGPTRIYLSKLDQELNVEWTSWLGDEYTEFVDWHGHMPTELLETRDGAFVFLFNNQSGGYVLVKTITFNNQGI